MTLLQFIQFVLGGLVAIDAFVRLVKVGKNTFAPIRHAFAALFAAGLAMAGATATDAVPATWQTAFLLLAILAVQTSTSHYWRHGVPSAFQRETS